MSMESPPRSPMPPGSLTGGTSGFRVQLQRSFTVDDFVRSETQLHLLGEEEEEVDLTEQELRDLYDSEEIERFLHLFSAYVTEVQVPETPAPAPHVALPKNATVGTSSNPDGPSSEDEEWTPTQATCTDGEYFPPRTPTKSFGHQSLSEEIVSRWLVPSLPPPRPPSQAFTFGRLRLALQRLYLAVLPTYLPFFQNLQNLATWENPILSSVYCTLFWTFWWHNLLAPALVGRIIFALFQRKLFLYPTLDELRRHRAEVQDADEFGAQITDRLSATSSNSMTEMWRLIRLIDHTRKPRLKKLKEKAKAAKEAKDRRSSTDSLSDSQEDITILEDSDNSEEAKDFKRVGLFVLDEIADLHERIENIFIWRKPSVSTKYAIALFLLFLVTLLPAKYLIKLLTFTLGALYWHVVPLMAALSEEDKRRLPPAFADVPTDAEYAMQLISERVEKGLDVTLKPTKRNKKNRQSTDSLPDQTRSSRTNSNVSLASTEPKKKSLFHKTSNTIVELMRLAPGSGFPIPESWPPQHPLIPSALGIAQPDANVETHTYPCQHTTSPGLITLTSRALFFTPLMSQNAKAVIPLSAVKGVKKTGLLKGLNLRWIDPLDSSREQREDKFHWVGGRDELFARLIGAEGLRWQKV